MATTKRPRTKKTAEAKETPVQPKASVKKQLATVTTRAVDVQEEIRLRAYELFQQRGFQHGADLEDWLRAEEEVRQRFGSAA